MRHMSVRPACSRWAPCLPMRARAAGGSWCWKRSGAPCPRRCGSPCRGRAFGGNVSTSRIMSVSPPRGHDCSATPSPWELSVCYTPLFCERSSGTRSASTPNLSYVVADRPSPPSTSWTITCYFVFGLRHTTAAFHGGSARVGLSPQLTTVPRAFNVLLPALCVCISLSCSPSPMKPAALAQTRDPASSGASGRVFFVAAMFLGGASAVADWLAPIA